MNRKHEWLFDELIHNEKSHLLSSEWISSRKKPGIFQIQIMAEILKSSQHLGCMDTKICYTIPLLHYESRSGHCRQYAKLKKLNDLQKMPGETRKNNYNGTLEMLEILLSTERNIEEKEKLLKSKFNIVMTPKMKEEAQIMGSYGLGMLEKGKREGISIGIEKGIEQGIEQGIEKGRFEERLSNIQSLITTLRLSAEQAMDALNIPQEERSQYLTKLKHLN